MTLVRCITQELTIQGGRRGVQQFEMPPFPRCVYIYVVQTETLSQTHPHTVVGPV